MSKFLILLFVSLSLAPASVFAQSLKPEDPFPLKQGLNTGSTDSNIGNHYWYFVGGPGKVNIAVRFKSLALFGNAQKCNLTLSMWDDKKTWRQNNVITSTGAMQELKLPGNLKTRTKVILCLAPPDHTLTRMGGDYEIEVNGAVSFGNSKQQGDPIVRTFAAKTHIGNGDFGAVKFLANGTIDCLDGSKGTWKLFDADNHIYKVDIHEIEGPVLSVSLRYVPGRGLCEMDGDNIAFQELK